MKTLKTRFCICNKRETDRSLQHIAKLGNEKLLLEIPHLDNGYAIWQPFPAYLTQYQ